MYCTGPGLQPVVCRPLTNDVFVRQRFSRVFDLTLFAGRMEGHSAGKIPPHRFLCSLQKCGGTKCKPTQTWKWSLNWQVYYLSVFLVGNQRLTKQLAIKAPPPGPVRAPETPDLFPDTVLWQLDWRLFRNTVQFAQQCVINIGISLRIRIWNPLWESFRFRSFPLKKRKTI